ncbi:MAG: hypothetical protein NTW58_00815, partial [Actinobacteria bacterium]|nr:hypothetical protein [Actinomycetota bacterium]
MSLVPRTFPPFPQREDLELIALLEPAREVGGDFYDFFLLDDDHLCLAIADVSGKGVPAAICLPSPVPSSKIGACTGAGRPAHGKGSVWMCKS